MAVSVPATLGRPWGVSVAADRWCAVGMRGGGGGGGAGEM